MSPLPIPCRALTIGLALGLAIGFNVVPSLTQAPAARVSAQDDFELPAGTEEMPRFMSLPFPKYARKSAYSQEDVRAIEDDRQLIKKYYDEGNYAAAEPIYGQYVALIEKIGITDLPLAEALQNYAELLRKLHKESEASAVQGRAKAIFARTETKGVAYNLKQFQLGMSLDEFTNLKPPDAVGGVAIKSICSCDKGQARYVITTDADRAAKVIQCGYWLGAPKSGAAEAAPFVMTVGGIRCSPDFRFIDDHGVYRLFDISISFFSSKYDDMRKALISKYGEPVSTDVDKTRTDMGGSFKIFTLNWDNNVSRIKLSNADARSYDRANLNYIHRELYQIYSNRLAEPKDKEQKTIQNDL